MRNLKRASLVSLVSVALLGTMALPANAAPEAGTTVTIEVAGGDLGITAPPTLTLSAPAPTVIGGAVAQATATGTLSGVSVSDLNADGIGWATTVALVFEDTALFETATVSFNTTGLQQSGASVVSGGDGGQIATSAENNTASWNTEVSVVIPAKVVVGDYAATLTSSVS